MRPAETGGSVLLTHIARQVAVGRTGQRRDIREVFAPRIRTLETEAFGELLPNRCLQAVVLRNTRIFGTLQTIRLETKVRHSGAGIKWRVRRDAIDRIR